MCNSLDDTEILIIIIVTFTISAGFMFIVSDYKLDGYKRAQQCINKHEASKQVCEDLYL